MKQRNWSLVISAEKCLKNELKAKQNRNHKKHCSSFWPKAHSSQCFSHSVCTSSLLSRGPRSAFLLIHRINQEGTKVRWYNRKLILTGGCCESRAGCCAGLPTGRAHHCCPLCCTHQNPLPPRRTHTKYYDKRMNKYGDRQTYFES